MDFYIITCFRILWIFVYCCILEIMTVCAQDSFGEELYVIVGNHVRLCLLMYLMLFSEYCAFPVVELIVYFVVSCCILFDNFIILSILRLNLHFDDAISALLFSPTKQFNMTQ